MNSESKSLKSEKIIERREAKEQSPEFLVNQEAALLAQFWGPGRKTAKILTLISSLLVGGVLSRTEAQEEPARSVSVETRGRERERQGDFYHITFNEERPQNREVLRKIDPVYATVINDSRARIIPLSRGDLRHLPEVDVDGYIANVVVFADSAVMPVMGAILRFEPDENGTVAIGDLTITPLFFGAFYGEEALGALERAGVVRRGANGLLRFVRGGYMIGSEPANFEYVGEPLFDETERRLTIRFREETSATQRVEVNFRQRGHKAFRVPGLENLLLPSQEPITFFGNDPSYAERIPELDRKMQSVFQGVRNVEDFLGTNLVDTVTIIDYRDNPNAFALWGKKIVFFLSRGLEFYNARAMEFIAEHEALHVFESNRRYTINRGIRGLFADLRGLEEPSRSDLLLTGSLPPFYRQRHIDSPLRGQLFFSFINESNYLHPDCNCGHSDETLDEFIASFVHTIMRIDLLERNLGRDLIIKKAQGWRERHTLTADEKLNILADYETFLSRLIEAADDSKLIEAADDNIRANRSVPQYRADRQILEGALNHVRALRSRLFGAVRQ